MIAQGVFQRLSDAGHRPENLTGEDLPAYPDPVALRGGAGTEVLARNLMGVLFEISIVCHVLCSWFWRGVGVSLFFLGGCSGFPSCFLGLLGFSVFLVRSAPACWGGGRVAGGSGVRGSVRPGGLLPFCWGAGLGCVCVRPVVLLVVWFWLWSGSVVGFGWRVLPGSRGGGRVVPGFLFVFAVLLSCSRGVFGCCFFRPVLSVFFWFPVLVFVVLPGVGGLWGVSGWVRGCFFSGFCCTGPGLFPVSFVGAGLGLGWVLFGEFDPGSGRTLAACLTHASRTGPLSFLGVG